MDKRRIYAALHEDIAEGFVWLKQDGLPARSIVKITYDGGGKSRSVYCEALQFENNFLRRYNRGHTKKIDSDQVNDSVVMNHWYRAKLGGTTPLTTQEPYSLRIVRANRWWGKLRAPMQHPQVVVRVATRLAVVSFCLGVLGLILAIVSIPGVARAIAVLLHPPSTQAGAAAAVLALPLFQPANATEVFNLRSKCAELGQGIMENNLIGSALYQHQESHYDPRSNRCYVELIVQPADPNTPSEHYLVDRVLYDGQTSEMLAIATWSGIGSTSHMTNAQLWVQNWPSVAADFGMDLKNGRWNSFDGNSETASDTNSGFIAAFIDAVMADDRKR